VIPPFLGCVSKSYRAGVAAVAPEYNPTIELMGRIS
jgi:hypothetical protein